MTEKEKQRQIEIEYLKYMQDVNEFAEKRAKQANMKLEQLGIEARINYSFEDKYNEPSLKDRILNYLKGLF